MKNFLVYVLTCVFCVNGFSQNADIDLLRKINLNRNRGLDPTFRFLSNSVTPLSIGVPPAITLYALIKKDSLHERAAIITMSTAAIAGIVTTSLKYSINRT